MISITTAMNTPINMSGQGRFPFITPSTIIFMSVACGAASSFVPKPHALLRSTSTPPIAIAEAKAPISSPICCLIGVAPNKNPVLRSCDVSPAIAATIQMTDPIVIAPIIPCIPVSPVIFRMNVAKSSVAIVIPETGLLLLPTSPTIREDTAPKKNPNTTTRIAPGRETGTCGTSQSRSTIIAIPARTNLMSRSISVRLPSPSFEARIPFRASTNVEKMSGIDLIRLKIPPAATIPEPI